ncbi:hypothetical protein K1719_015876 [Acacia pycnantha]|nr:hypothetical protein K1719_015876 [Acacia pycnantha]
MVRLINKGHHPKRSLSHEPFDEGNMSGNSKAVKLQNAEGKEEEEEEEEEEERARVTRELQINGGGKMGMDKQVILKRIRQRKRMNKFTAALQSLVTSPFSKSNTPTPPHNSSFHDHLTFF